MTIKPAERAAGLNEVTVLLDIRKQAEHDFCSLPGSRLLSLVELPDRVAEVADLRDRETVVYGHQGVRSDDTIGLLRQFGFERLINLSGGIDRCSLEVDPTAPRY